MDCSNGNIIDGFESMIGQVLLPVLKSQNVRSVVNISVVAS